MMKTFFICFIFISNVTLCKPDTKLIDTSVVLEQSTSASLHVGFRAGICATTFLRDFSRIDPPILYERFSDQSATSSYGTGFYTGLFMEYASTSSHQQSQNSIGASLSFASLPSRASFDHSVVAINNTTFDTVHTSSHYDESNVRYLVCVGLRYCKSLANGVRFSLEPTCSYIIKSESSREGTLSEQNIWFRPTETQLYQTEMQGRRIVYHRGSDNYLHTWRIGLLGSIGYTLDMGRGQLTPELGYDFNIMSLGQSDYSLWAWRIGCEYRFEI